MHSQLSLQSSPDKTRGEGEVHGEWWWWWRGGEGGVSDSICRIVLHNIQS